MKSCIVIGGGADIVGRQLGARIDAGAFGVVIRVNKPYGEAVDVGSRTDVLVTRWQSWVGRFFSGREPCSRVVINEHLGISPVEIASASAEIGWRSVSAGLLACQWALNRGASRVFVIGFGYRRGQGWSALKTYPDGTVDSNERYNWPVENRWLQNNVTLL